MLTGSESLEPSNFGWFPHSDLLYFQGLRRLSSATAMRARIAAMSC
jgi:hypothetical protein